MAQATISGAVTQATISGANALATISGAAAQTALEVRTSQISTDGADGVSKGEAASLPSSHEGKYVRDYAQQHGVREVGLDQRQLSMHVAIRSNIRLHMLAVDDLREHAAIAIILDPAVDGFDHGASL
jgi:hypothetical protein